MSSKMRDRITEAYVLRRKVEQLERDAKRLRIIEWWKVFWKARSCGYGHQAKVHHSIIETRKGLWDEITFVCSCGELYPVTGIELAQYCY